MDARRPDAAYRIGSDSLFVLEEVGIALAVNVPGDSVADGDARQNGKQQERQGQHDEARIGAEQGKEETQNQSEEGNGHEALAAFIGVLIPLQSVDLLQIG